MFKASSQWGPHKEWRPDYAWQLWVYRRRLCSASSPLCLRSFRSWVPAAVYLLATGKIVKGLILLGLGAGVISMLDNIIRPLVVGNKMRANPLVLMLAMLGGVQTFGFLGLFIGPVVVAMIIASGKMLSEEITEATAVETTRGP